MDGDMNDILQKLNTVLDDPNMSNNLKNILNNFSSSDNKTTSETNSEKFSQENDRTTSSDEENKKNNSSSPEFDLNTILKIKNIMDSLNNSENDARSNLLLSLKPYLTDKKKDKIDQYIKFLHFAKVIEILNPMGGDKFNNE